MKAAEFLERWRAAGPAERANKDLFLSELCRVLDVEIPRPKTNDPEKDSYVYEKDVVRPNESGESIGRIDLYRAGCFVLEAKQIDAAKRDSPAWQQAMNDALGQALGYAKSLPQPPPFVVVCDIGYCFDLHASFDGSGAYRPFPDGFRKRLKLDDLERHRETLRQLWLEPLALDPARQQAKVTKEVAAKIAALARELEAAKHDPERVATFLMRCLFTMFAEDVGLLPEKLFSKHLHDYWIPSPSSFPGGVGALWRDMNEGRDTPAGKLLRFNGGLFADSEALPLSKPQLELLAEAAKGQWNEVDPSIFGTLLERALDPRERHRLGAHYTPRAYVERLVKPTIEEPLRGDWDLVRAEVRQLVEAGRIEKAQERVRDFHRRLCSIRVLDPACGTGNFLYVSLDLFKRLETEVLSALEGLGYSQMGLEMEKFRVTPEQFRGIEVKRWAKEIAELVLWIGYLQWQVRQSGEAKTVPEPVLRDYGNIECRDAVLAWDGDPELARDENGKPITRWDGTTTKKSPVTGEEIPDETATIPVWTYKNPRPAEWPKADFIIGNPPYVGARRIRSALGDAYVDALRQAWPQVSETADYVLFWWDRAAAEVASQATRRFGLITTNSIVQDYSRPVLEKHLNAEGSVRLVFAIADHPWTDEATSAAVRVAMTVGEAKGRGSAAILGGVVDESDPEGCAIAYSRVSALNSSLRSGSNSREATALEANRGICFQGVVPAGDGFKLEAAELEELRIEEENLPTVVRPYLIGRDLVQRQVRRFIIDFFGLPLERARSHWPALFQRLVDRVKPERDLNKRPSYREKWWIFAEPRPAMRTALSGLSRYISTPYTSRHRVFLFVEPEFLTDAMAYAIALDSGFSLGVLSSRLHAVWADRAGGRLGVGNDFRYTSNATFLPFPFPVCAFQDAERIRALGEALDAHRKRQQAAYPGLTITGMYNVLEKLRSGEALTAKERVIHEQGLVSVLKQIHDELDAAVFAAYGWPATLTDEEILERLVALNHERAEEEKRGLVRWLRPEFQNPKGDVVSTQQALPGTEPKGKAKKGGQAAAGGKRDKAAKRAWPKELPQQVAAARELLAESGTLDLARAKAAFKGAKEEALAASLDSLAALGLAVSSGEGRSRVWAAVR